MFEVRGTEAAGRGDLLPAEVTADTRAPPATMASTASCDAASLAFSAPPDLLTADRGGFLAVRTADPGARTELYVEVRRERPRTPSRSASALRPPARASACAQLAGAAPACARLGPPVQRVDGQIARRPRAADHRARRPAPIRMPAFPGSRRRSAATRSSPRCRCCGSIRRWRAACCAFWRGIRRRETRRSATPRPARSCTRRARARWRRCASCRSAVYYGGVDTTPLFVDAGRRLRERTGDMALIDELWPSLAAQRMAWIESARRQRSRRAARLRARVANRACQPGLEGQPGLGLPRRWPIADGPIALVEVQGYAYAALRSDGGSRRHGAAQRDAAAHWRSRARGTCATAVEARFWMEELGFLRHCARRRRRALPRASVQRGPSLFTGLPTSERARRVAGQLLGAAFQLGLGHSHARAQAQPRFNPMSYHNGSVWPHDTALCAARPRTLRRA